MAALKLEDLGKRDNLETFLGKWERGETFTFTDGKKKKLKLYREDIAKILRGAVKGDANSLKLFRTKEIRELLPLTSMEKTAEFGGKGAGNKPTGTVKYGRLAALDLSKYDTTQFLTISTLFSQGKLVSTIKEASDVKAVSDFNTALDSVLDDSAGLTLTIAGFRFTNIIGCIPVTNGEPKADIVLVKIDVKKKALTPAAFISYKMGTDAKGFQQYSGLSEKSSPVIFKHAETKQFFKKLAANNKRDVTKDEFQIIKDKSIIGKAVWGLNYGSVDYDIDNVHFLAQGEVSISGNRLVYSHTHKNGDFKFTKEYEPVFGARNTPGRNNKGPDGIDVANYRIGIFPRAYRTKWLQDP